MTVDYLIKYLCNVCNNELCACTDTKGSHLYQIKKLLDAKNNYVVEINRKMSQ